MYEMFVIPGYLYLYYLTAYQTFVIPDHQYVNWWTHKIGGLHKNDFIMAAKTDELYQ